MDAKIIGRACLEGQSGGIDATVAIDWVVVRRLLAGYREREQLTESQLAKAIDKPKSTIYRVENLDNPKEHRPDLETIDRWLAATRGRLSEFFLQVEDRVTVPGSFSPNTPLKPMAEGAQNASTPERSGFGQTPRATNAHVALPTTAPGGYTNEQWGFFLTMLTNLTGAADTKAALRLIIGPSEQTQRKSQPTRLPRPKRRKTG